ncbi:MAG: winged helix-turn-helix domain-containing protein [Proteobacteria bacterium]|nr:winged helix-turn-helix domain-containing protein [Pseudomonadota bacterium]
MLNLNLQIQDLLFLEALEEILPQAGIYIKKDETECEGVLCTSLQSECTLPSLNLALLSRPLRLLDLLSLLENLPYSQDLSFSSFSLDLRERILKNVKTQKVHRLTGKECQLLRFFHQNKGQELSKDTLLKEIWEYHPDAATHTLETHIYRLRQKLEDDSACPQLLRNCKDGYVFSVA